MRKGRLLVIPPTVRLIGRPGDVCLPAWCRMRRTFSQLRVPGVWELFPTWELRWGNQYVWSIHKSTAVDRFVGSMVGGSVWTWRPWPGRLVRCGWPSLYGRVCRTDGLVLQFGADLAGQLTVGPFGVEQGGAQGTAGVWLLMLVWGAGRGVLTERFLP